MLIRILTCLGFATLLACSPDAELSGRSQGTESSSSVSYEGRIDARNQDLYAAQIQEHGLRGFSAEFCTFRSSVRSPASRWRAWLNDGNPIARLTFPTARAERIAHLRAECEVYSAGRCDVPHQAFEAEVRFYGPYALAGPRAVVDCCPVLWADPGP